MFTAECSGPVHPVDVRLAVLGVETVLRYYPASGQVGAGSSEWEGIAYCLIFLRPDTVKVCCLAPPGWKWENFTSLSPSQQHTTPPNLL